MKITNKRIVGCSAYGVKKAKKLSKAELEKEKNIKKCLRCTEPNCRGWCEKIKRSKA